MSKKDKIDWDKLTEEPLSAESESEMEPKQVRQKIDWSLLTQTSRESQNGSDIIELDERKEKKEQLIDWSKLTKSSR